MVPKNTQRYRLSHRLFVLSNEGQIGGGGLDQDVPLGTVAKRNRPGQRSFSVMRKYNRPDALENDSSKRSQAEVQQQG
jgi:hypothetical protein